MKIIQSILLLLIILVSACGTGVPDAEEIVNKSITLYGGELYRNCEINFDFRGRHYTIERNQGLYSYHRFFSDSSGQYHDVLNNDGFVRMINDQEIAVDPEWVGKYSNSVNSVVYFALLPFGLNDPAVIKEYLGEEEIQGNTYYKIRVTFLKEGGGKDHEDEFIYWFQKDTYRMDYFAYSYETDEGGIRFREAVNPREVSGILFQDYINYKGEKSNKDVSGLAKLYEEGKLEKLSEIKLENIEVKSVNQ